MSQVMNEHIRHLQGELKEAVKLIDEAKAIMARQSQRIEDLEDRLRPFEETYNRASAHTSSLDHVEVIFRNDGGVLVFMQAMDVQDFARAAEPVPE